MGGEASGQGRQVKHILVLFAICRPSVPRSGRFSSLFPLLQQNQLAQNRLVGAFGAPGQPAVPLPDGSLLACYVLPGMSPPAAAVTLPWYSWLVVPAAAEDRYRVPAFVSLNASLEARCRTLPKSGMPSIISPSPGSLCFSGDWARRCSVHSTWRSPPARRTRVYGDRGLRRLPKWRCFNQV
jgi:hypothetical protein